MQNRNVFSSTDRCIVVPSALDACNRVIAAGRKSSHSDISLKICCRFLLFIRIFFKCKFLWLNISYSIPSSQSTSIVLVFRNSLSFTSVWSSASFRGFSFSIIELPCNISHPFFSSPCPTMLCLILIVLPRWQAANVISVTIYSSKNCCLFCTQE